MKIFHLPAPLSVDTDIEGRERGLKIINQWTLLYVEYFMRFDAFMVFMEIV